VRSYSQGDPTAPRALINSNGQIEVFVKKGSAAEALKVSRGETITLA
jgi:S-adenosylmethionine hydrolase